VASAADPLRSLTYTHIQYGFTLNYHYARTGVVHKLQRELPDHTVSVM
jgi:hypothetical protein